MILLYVLLFIAAQYLAYKILMWAVSAVLLVIDIIIEWFN